LKTQGRYSHTLNVRELENAVEHAFVLCNSDKINLFDLPVEIRQFDFLTEPEKFCPLLPEKKSDKSLLSKEILLDLLFKYDWNKAAVARHICLSRAAIWKYMKKWDIPNEKPA